MDEFPALTEICGDTKFDSMIIELREFNQKKKEAKEQHAFGNN